VLFLRQGYPRECELLLRLQQRRSGSQFNEQEMTEIWKELKDKRYERIISYAFSTFFLFSGVVGVIKTSSSFPVWMVVASFIVSALLFISSARCVKRMKELKRKLERQSLSLTLHVMG